MAVLKPEKVGENNLIGFPEVWAQPKCCPSETNSIMVLVV